jgi:hypothetical protein
MAASSNGITMTLSPALLCNIIFLGRAFLKSPRPPRYFHSTSVCQLNRFLFDPSEVESGESSSPRVVLPKDDYRTIHAANILGLENGDKIRAGVVSCEEHNGLWTDEATIQWIPEGKVKKAEVLKNGKPPGSLSIQLDNLSSPDAPSDQILVSLILALPRPLQLGRMLPMISQMGVYHLVLTGASKVPKDYFGSHLFSKPGVLQACSKRETCDYLYFMLCEICRRF